MVRDPLSLHDECYFSRLSIPPPLPTQPLESFFLPWTDPNSFCSRLQQLLGHAILRPRLYPRREKTFSSPRISSSIGPEGAPPAFHVDSSFQCRRLLCFTRRSRPDSICGRFTPFLESKDDMFPPESFHMRRHGGLSPYDPDFFPNVRHPGLNLLPFSFLRRESFCSPVSADLPAMGTCVKPTLFPPILSN